MITLHDGRVAALEWVRSECKSGACVEVATEHGYVLVRSSSIPLEIIRFTPQEWCVFLRDVRSGKFDLIDEAQSH